MTEEGATPLTSMVRVAKATASVRGRRVGGGRCDVRWRTADGPCQGKTCRERG